jgi:carboxyl-terminal processing protease
MLRKARILLLGAVMGAVSALAFTRAPVSITDGAAHAATAEKRPAFDQFREIYLMVRDHYVDLPDDSKLIKGAIAGLMRTLDPHSEYLDAQSFRAIQEEAVGVFGGLGFKVSMENDLIKVGTLVANSHAASAGIRPGDLIVRLDGVAVRGLTINQAIERMRGPVGSAIRLIISRKGQPEPMEVSVIRDRIRVQTVSARAIGGDVGYIKIAKFNDLTGEDLQKALLDLSTRIPANQLRGYVLDLRNNPGGVLEQAVSVAGAFLKSGDIVTTRGRNPEDNRHFTATGAWDDPGKRKPLFVLINGGSASAAEIVAGALQDHKRATVVGSSSFGKGSVQSISPIGTGNGALKLTTAFYYTPSGHSIQAKGITPDIEVTQEGPGAHRVAANGEAMLPNHLKGEGEERSGSEAYVPPDSNDDKALRMAVDLLRVTPSHPDFPAK